MRHEFDARCDVTEALVAQWITLFTVVARGKICIEYSDVTNYNCNRRGLLTIKGNPAFRQVNKRGYW